MPVLFTRPPQGRSPRVCRSRAPRGAPKQSLRLPGARLCTCAVKSAVLEGRARGEGVRGGASGSLLAPLDAPRPGRSSGAQTRGESGAPCGNRSLRQDFSRHPKAGPGRRPTPVGSPGAHHSAPVWATGGSPISGPAPAPGQEEGSPAAPLCRVAALGRPVPGARTAAGGLPRARGDPGRVSGPWRDPALAALAPLAPGQDGSLTSGLGPPGGRRGLGAPERLLL